MEHSTFLLLKLHHRERFFYADRLQRFSNKTNGSKIRGKNIPSSSVLKECQQLPLKSTQVSLLSPTFAVPMSIKLLLDLLRTKTTLKQFSELPEAENCPQILPTSKTFQKLLVVMSRQKFENKNIVTSSLASKFILFD